jgi:glycine dehydrogenase subunit 1
MPYLVHSPEDRAAMLATIGAASMEPLLSDIPASLRIRRLDLPDGLSEPEAMGRIRSLRPPSPP